MIDGMTVLRTYGTEVEAEMVAAMLHAYGLEALVSTDDAGGMYPAMAQLRAIKLLVWEKDLEEAKALLEAEGGGDESGGTGGADDELS
ncbi:MAG: DUF2007 domain-containing protein [bacterium]|nr:DUF2007 domain-containing protein [bacterium]